MTTLAQSTSKRLLRALAFGLASLMPLASQAAPQASGPAASTPATTMPATPSISPQHEQAVSALSQQLWRWMSDRNTDALATLFHDKAMFVHMSRTLSKSAELEVIRSGSIQYKKVDIQDTSVRVVGNTAIVLTKMRLGAIVRDNEVSNPFIVTEVYVQQGTTWSLASLAFTRLVGD